MALLHGNNTTQRFDTGINSMHFGRGVNQLHSAPIFKHHMDMVLSQAATSLKLSATTFPYNPYHDIIKDTFTSVTGQKSPKHHE